MISDDERREVAARLRVLASHKAADEELTLDALGLYRGNNIEGFDTHCVMELADLIEPPTCKNLATHLVDELVCSACGERVDIAYLDKDDDYRVRYCPICGAKVVDE